MIPASRDLDEDVPRYYDSLDFKALWREFPPAPEYFRGTYVASPEELRAAKDERFRWQVARCWQIPFYQRHWGAAGLKPGDIRGLADLEKIPVFDVHDLRKSIERCPPFGDFVGIDFENDAAIPMVLQTSGGTTGLPRPMIFAPRDREVMNIITGRRLYMQGVRPYDRLQVVLSLGLANGGFLAREGIWKYTGAIPVMTGSGAQTPTRRQLEIMGAWKTNFLVGFPAYLRHMAVVAREELGIDPKSYGMKGLIVHLGTDNREALQDLWGAPCYDTYGTNEFGSIAAECSEQSGLHVFEDAFELEVRDQDTMAPKGPGERGVVVLTSLFKYAAPMIRFNTNDVSAWVPGTCACGSTHPRIGGIYGRADNMVKLRGTNVFPEAVGALVSENRATNGEYCCVVERVDDDGRDEMTVHVEAADASVDAKALAAALAGRIKEALGVKMAVVVAARGELAAMTGLDATSKVKRLIDKRPRN
jgi:phenylacetate-CoA ligase